MKTMFIMGELQDESYRHTVPGDMTISFPLTLKLRGDMKINVIHTGMTQDHSLRCWFSHEPNHGPENPHIQTSYWHANRSNNEFSIVHDSVIDTSFIGGMHRPRLPGIFYLNVQNLINTTNEFVVIVEEPPHPVI